MSERITKKQRELLASVNTGGVHDYCGSWWHIATLHQKKLIYARLLQSRNYSVQITEAGRKYLESTNGTT